MAFRVDNNVVYLDDFDLDYLYDDKDYDHSLYLVFDKTEYKTPGDIAKVISNIVTKYHSIKPVAVDYNVSKDISSKDNDIITLVFNDIVRILIVIPPREEVLNPVREEIYISVTNRNGSTNGLVMSRSLGDINLEIANSLMRW